MLNLYNELISSEVSAESERKILSSYENNSFFKKSASGEQSIESALKNLVSIEKPVERLFPRKLNETHNSEVQELEQLLGDLGRIKSNGFSSLDNFFSGSVNTSMGFYVLYNLLGYVFDGLPPSEEKRLMVNHYVDGLIGANLLISAFFLGPASQLSRAKKIPYDQAKRLDKRIKELYCKPTTP